MDSKTEKILREFEKRAAVESKRMEQMDQSSMEQHIDEFLLSLGPATILEVGSSGGYSTVWLAEAARETAGKVISLELRPQKQEHARASVREVGLGRRNQCPIRGLRGSIDSVLLPVGSESN